MFLGQSICHTCKAKRGMLYPTECTFGILFMCRCVELQPLCAAAHRALGLVAEARGDAAEAALELELALELTLSDDPQQGMCVACHPSCFSACTGLIVCNLIAGKLAEPLEGWLSLPALQ